VNAVPGIKYGIAFNEASGVALVRYHGNDEELVELAKGMRMPLALGISLLFHKRCVSHKCAKCCKNGT